MKTLLLATAAALGALVSVPAHAALLGQTINYCTNSVYSGAATFNPASCDNNVVFTEGTTTIADPGLEINLAGNRFVDFTDNQIIISYDNTGSPSADLYVITGLSGILGLSLVSDNLGVESIFASDAIGLLVSGNPNGPGRAVFNVTVGRVPEPLTWAMMLVGFGFVGSQMRKRSLRAA